MRLVAALKMLPTPAQATCLMTTLERCNAAATWAASVAFDAGTLRRYDLHKITYHLGRERFRLTAQAMVLVLDKVAASFKINKTIAPVFRSDGSQAYDSRIIRFVKDGSAVNLWTIEGRITVPIVMGEHQKRLMAYRKGEVDLCYIRGKWMLAATCDIPETQEFKAEDWLGVDLGIVSLAVDSDGKVYTGTSVEQTRRHHQRRRNGLQKRGTKAAKRRLRKLSGKQARYQKHTNHCIAKAVVLDAERTDRGIALEQLKGIRNRVTARSNQRTRLGNWGFAQLGAFVCYKAKRVGVPMVFVDPRDTSRQCRECGCIDKKNRTNQASFSCVSCGHQVPADLNAARNIRAKASVTTPCVLAA